MAFETPARGRIATGPSKPEFKKWSTVDEITHDFNDCPAFRRWALQTHGQYIDIDGNRIQAEKNVGSHP